MKSRSDAGRSWVSSAVPEQLDNDEDWLQNVCEFDAEGSVNVSLRFVKLVQVE